jgi:hypothetical protein
MLNLADTAHFERSHFHESDNVERRNCRRIADSGGATTICITTTNVKDSLRVEVQPLISGLP